MIDAPLIAPPAIVAPASRVDRLQDLEPVKKRRKGSRDDRRTIPQGALFVGAIILLSGSDGEAVACEVVQVEPLVCIPVE
jgi:hypothetical protein